MKVELFQKLMLSYLSVPYIYGGKNPLVGFDCSGLTCEILKAVGFLKTNDEYGSQQLFGLLKGEAKMGDSSPRTGSLVFYGTDESHIDHVAIFLDEKYIVEAGHGTADTTTREAASQRGAFVRVRPYTYRNDFVCILNIDLGLVP